VQIAVWCSWSCDFICTEVQNIFGFSRIKILVFSSVTITLIAKDFCEKSQNFQYARLKFESGSKEPWWSSDLSLTWCATNTLLINLTQHKCKQTLRVLLNLELNFEHKSNIRKILILKIYIKLREKILYSSQR